MTKQAYEVTIHAICTRMVGDQTGAEEDITSTFLAYGEDALVASNGVLAAFRVTYGEILQDIDVRELHVIPHREE